MPDKGTKGCQTRTRLDHLEVKLLGDAIGEIGRAYFRDRQAPSCDDQAVCEDVTSIRFYPELFTAFADRPHCARHAPGHIAERAFGFQHADDVFRRVITEQLAFMLLVVGNAIALHQREEVLRRIARQGTFAKMRVLRKEVLRRRVYIGEVAAATARDADFFCELGCVIYQHYAFAALAGN
jgi:hypothetical protein